jgi:hypothetical protein
VGGIANDRTLDLDQRFATPLDPGCAVAIAGKWQGKVSHSVVRLERTDRLASGQDLFFRGTSVQLRR